MSEQMTAEAETTESKRDHPDREHLQGVEDGCGCTEVWEHLSENRDD